MSGPRTRSTVRPRQPPRRRRARSETIGWLTGHGRVMAIAVVAVVALVAGLLVARGGDSGAQRVAADFTQAWTHHDYTRMYADIDPATRRSIAVTQFAADFRDAEATATVTALNAGRPRAHGSTMTVPVLVQTRVFGALPLSYELPISGSGSDAKIAFDQSLVFPGLRRGSVLTRHTSLARRATLLASDGTPIASIGPAAADIVGVLGPVPASRAAELRAAGYPPGAQVGVSGLQLAFQDRLAGVPGGQLFAGARLLASTVPQAAASVRTTIVPKLQRAAVAALQSAGALGAVVLLQPSTGAIEGVAGGPFSDRQPPGSTFKIVTLTGALEAGIAKPQSSYPYATDTTLSGVKLQNANGESCGGSLANAFAVSCNSVFAPLGAKLGARRLVQTAESFGFNQRPSIPNVAESTIPAADKLGDDLAVGSSAIGQGQVQATALQMAVIAATIGLGGRRPTPTLAPDQRQPPVPAVPVSVARTVRRLMIGVVEHGTGTAAAIPGVRVAGKTGTAELRSTVCPAGVQAQQQPPSQQQSGSQPSCDPSNPKNTDAWFVAFAPSQAPRVAVGVLLVQDGAGGTTAAPVARQALLAALGR